MNVGNHRSRHQLPAPDTKNHIFRELPLRCDAPTALNNYNLRMFVTFLLHSRAETFPQATESALIAFVLVNSAAAVEPAAD